jgi:large subunit ribosomal protein L18
VINDHDGKTLASASSLDKIIEKSVSKAKSKIEVSTLVGATLAERAIKNKVKEVVFDRNGYPYHGRVKAVADAAREAGLEF